MAGRLNLKSRFDERPKTPSRVLKINKYENPKSALDLISHICTTGISLQSSEYSSRIFSFFDDEWEPKTKDSKTGEPLFFFGKQNFLLDLKWDCYHHLNDIADDPYDTIDIVVAGGFSAGKSRLLNRITGLGKLLPTGVEPVSVVNTKIVCDKEIRNFCIRGRNLRNQKVALNADVLQCIQHSSKSNVYVASVLDGISIYRPTGKNESIEGITFIDTPGYNNSISKNHENNKSDRDTAIEAINDADALIWCIDIEAGTITETDINMLSGIKEGMPVVIMFTQMDKKSDNEIRIILKKAINLAERRLKGLTIVRIMAYSANEDRAIMKKYVNPGKPIDSILKDIKLRCKGNVNFIRDIEKRINDEIVLSQNTFDNYEKQRIEAIKNKNEWIEYVRKDKKIVEDDKETLEYIVEQWKSDDLDSWIDQLKSNFEIYTGYYIDKRQKNLDETIEQQKNFVQKKRNEELCTEFLREFKVSLMDFLNELKHDLKNKYFFTNSKIEEIKEVQQSDIFMTIKQGNYERFIQCFHLGQNIGVLNKDGYTPLTYAVKEGNNQMVNFFLQNGVDARYCDGRGYNAFETAIVNHYQDICEIILEYDNDIMNSVSKSLEELSSLNTFSNWLKIIKNEDHKH